MTATAVYLTADTEPNYDGDEVDVYFVSLGDDDGEPVGTVYTVRRGYSAALSLAERIAADRDLELVVE